MKIRFTDRPDITGFSDRFNIHALAEVIVGFDGDGGMDTCFIKELEVFIEAKQAWVPMNQAFKDKDIIPDNYNTWFAEPKSEADRERGWYG